VIITIITRRLRDGRTYEDFRAAWKPDKGFGVPTRVVSGQSPLDEREVVTIGFTDIPDDAAQAFLEKVGPQETVRHDRLAAVVEDDVQRAFYIQVADDDLTDGPPPD
jgi:hypothetical protein